MIRIETVLKLLLLVSLCTAASFAGESSDESAVIVKLRRGGDISSLLRGYDIGKYRQIAPGIYRIDVAADERKRLMESLEADSAVDYVHPDRRKRILSR
jgi:hypothetical protein